MPLALRELQAAFADHLKGVDRADLESAVVGDTISAIGRIGVHRNHVRHSLTAALAATFPTIHAVVGEAFFGVLARAFIARSLPVQPVLAEYGDGFADFIEGFSQADSLPYLADVARLDWALNVAFHRSPEQRLAIADLAAIPPDLMPGLRLELAAGAAIVRSRFPIDRIWRISQPGAANEQVDLEAGGACLLVLRRVDDAAFVELSDPEAAFVAAVDRGSTLEGAAQESIVLDPDFDLSAGFARLVGVGIFGAMQQQPRRVTEKACPATIL